jgi:hypothetical protein
MSDTDKSDNESDTGSISENESVISQSDNEEVVLHLDDKDEDEILDDVGENILNLEKASGIDLTKDEESLKEIEKKIATAKAAEDDAQKKAKEVLGEIKRLCDDRTNTIEGIKAELKSSDISKIPIIHKEAKELFKDFEIKVQEQENEIEVLEEKLKDVTINKFEEFELEVENIKPYADNESSLEALDKAMKKKEDDLEDEKIIHEVHEIINNKVSENTEYTQEQKEEDKEKVAIIVKASLKEMLEESNDEIDKFKEYNTTENDERKNILRNQLGIAKYNLSPNGVDAVYQYIEEAKPEPEKGKKVTQIHREYNIDILNLLIGGLLTQYYVDKVNSMDNLEDDLDKKLEEWDSRMDLLKEKINIFTDVVTEQNPDKMKEIADEIRKKEKEKSGSFGKRRSNFGDFTIWKKAVDPLKQKKRGEKQLKLLTFYQN